MSVPTQHVSAQNTQEVVPDRRRHERQRTRTPMHIVKISEEPVTYEAECTDVSIGGLGFNTSVQLRAGEVIEFEFVNADHAGLTFEARVLYRSGEHYGAYFMRTD